MIEESFSRILFFYYSRPFSPRTDPLYYMSSFIHHLLQIVSKQHKYRYVQNAILLSEGSKEMIPLHNASLLEGRSFFFPIPVCALFRASEDLIRITTPLEESQESRFTVQRFFNRCGINDTSSFKFIALQSGIRHLLHTDKELLVQHPSALEGILSHDPFWIDQKKIFADFFIGFQDWETSLFQNKYLTLDEKLFPIGMRTDMFSSQSLYLTIYMIFLTILHLFVSEEHNEMMVKDLCLKLSYKCIDFLISKLSIFRHPSLMSCLVDEFFRFSGILCEIFSSDEDENMMLSSLLFSLFAIPNVLTFINVNSIPEWNFRYQAKFLKDIDLCAAFLNAYTSEGRSSAFHWTHVQDSYILVSLRPFFRKIFSYWLTACHNKISPFVQAHNNLSLCLSSRNLSLASLSAFKILEQERCMSDEQVYTSLNLLLRDDEETSPGNEAQSFVIMRALFYKYHSEERVRKCIEAHLLRLEGYMNTSFENQARACFLSLLHMTAYCEASFTSFHRIQRTSKLLVHTLMQFGSPSTSVTAQFLLIRLILLFSTSRCNLFEIIHSRQFWRSVIQLFSYKENALREAKLKRLYEDETGPSSVKKMRLSSL